MLFFFFSIIYSYCIKFYFFFFFQKSIASEQDFINLVNKGSETKTVKSTNCNEYSSRSHTIFTCEILQKFPNGAEKKGKLNLIDLAGSEKVLIYFIKLFIKFYINLFIKIFIFFSLIFFIN